MIKNWRALTGLHENFGRLGYHFGTTLAVSTQMKRKKRLTHPSEPKTRSTCGQDGISHVWHAGAEYCDCGTERAPGEDDEIAWDEEVDFEIARSALEEGRHIDRLTATRQLAAEHTRIAALVQEMRRRQQWIDSLSYEDMASEIERSLDSGGGLLIVRDLRVGGWPEFLKNFHQETGRRLNSPRESASRKSGERGERIFKQLQDRFKIAHRLGRPRVDSRARSLRATPSVLGDLPAVAKFMASNWSSDSVERGEASGSWILFMEDFAGVARAIARKKIYNLLKRKGLRPKAVAVSLLTAKWSQKFRSLREAEVNGVITPHWLQFRRSARD